MEYTFLAIDTKGKEKKGTIDASTTQDAGLKLKQKGLIAIELKKATFLTRDLNITIGNSVKARDLSVFCRQLVSMISAGVTITSAFEMLSDQTENKQMAKAIRGVQSEIEKGEPLAEAMANYPKVFPSTMISMIAAGQAAGKLESILERMAVHFEKSAKIRALMKKASVYPIIVSIVAVAVVVVMLVKIIPGYMDMFSQLDVELPLITQMVIAASEFLLSYWYVLLLLLIGVTVGLRWFAQTIQGQVLFGNIQRKMPIFGKLTVKTAASQYARTLGTMLYSGMSMLEAITITASTMSNYIYKKTLLDAKEEVAKGIPISEPLERSEVFPPMVTHMTKIGEETGDLEEMLSRLADYYDEEVELTTQTVMAAMEPLIILVLAAIVGILIAAVMSPMVSMYSALDNL